MKMSTIMTMTIMTTAIIAIAALTGISLSPALKRKTAQMSENTRAKKNPPKAGSILTTGYNLPLVHCVLECLASRELDGLGGRNLNGFAGLRVTAGARCALARTEASEANQLHGVTLRDGLLDHFEQRVQRFAGLSLAGAGLSGHGVDQFLFIH